MATSLLLIAALLAAAGGASAQEMPRDYAQALTTLGRQGDYRDNVLKINIPRSDLQVAVDGIATPTPLGFGGWIAFARAEAGMDVMMGDLVLTEDEVNSVMSAVLDAGFDVTALHNHFFWERPRMFYMHVHAHGAVGDIATRIKPALDRIGKATARATNTATNGGRALAGSLDTAALARIVGHTGEQTGAVYKITIGRPDIAMKEMGALINARMGLNTWAAFYGTDAEAVVAGDVAMLEREVTPVLKALRAKGLDIVAIHHHMTGTSPVVIFLHYWGKGRAASLAEGVRAAVDLLGRPAQR